MKLRCAILGALAIASLSTTAALGNGAPPRQVFPDTIYAHIDVAIDPTNDVASLRISEADLLKAGFQRKPPPGLFGDASPSRPRSIIAALALSFSAAGVFLTRKRRTAALAIALVSATIVGTMGVEAWANMAPARPIITHPIIAFPPPPPSPVQIPFTAYDFNGDEFLRSRTSVRNPQAGYNILDLVHEPAVYGMGHEIQAYLRNHAPRQGGIESLPPIPFATPPKVTTAYPFSTTPTSVSFGVDGLTPHFADMLQLKSGPGGVRVDRGTNLDTVGAARDYYRGEVMIKISAAETGVKLTLGTKNSLVLPKVVNAVPGTPIP